MSAVVVVNSRINCSSYLQSSLALAAVARRRAHHVSTTSAIAVSVTTPITSLHVKPPQPILKQRGGCMIVKASSSEIDGIVVPENAVSSESVKEEVAIDKLPLESKMQLMLEQKEKMKLAKKIRLRRKRLVQGSMASFQDEEEQKRLMLFLFSFF